jgi:succinate dehydrogenase / fumarate reductase flavoprotein subunit
MHRNESGGHFREEYQTADGEATRDDENFAYVAAWEYKGKPSDAVLQRALVFDNVKLVTRSYK